MPAIAARSFAMVMLPLYVVPAVIALLFLVVITTFSSYVVIQGGVPNTSGLIAAVVLALLAAPGFIAFSMDDGITFAQDGITLPFRFAPLLRFKRKRLWREVIGVTGDIKTDQGGQRISGRVCLEFDSGESVTIDLSGVDKEDLPVIAVALDVCTPETVDKKCIAELKRFVSNSAGLIEGNNASELWELELANRFHPTVFVPMEAAEKIYDGKLKIVRQLALGGMSAVYLAQLSGRKLVILKESCLPLDADQASKDKMIELFHREASILTKLKHDRIAGVLDYFIENNRHYLILEYIKGANLRQRVREHGPQDQVKVIEWMRQISDVLNYLHTLNPPIIHRDVTPENIVVTEDGGAVLIDFGAANEWLGTATGTIIGKHNFMGPEQFRGKAECSSDLYSLGCTAYFLLTGKDPVVFSQCSPRKDNPEVSESLDALIQSLTEQSPTDRPSSASDVLIQLSKLETQRVAKANL